MPYLFGHVPAEKWKDYKMTEDISSFFRQTQSIITQGLEQMDGGGRFLSDTWEHKNGGGGNTMVLSNGKVFERAGVNFSKVFGDTLPPSILEKFPEAKNSPFMATGVSLVIHPLNPYVPTIHMNYRYFKAGSLWWFGGGTDLTPYYPFEEDVRQFHQSLKTICDRHDPDFYPRFKQWCDEYFFIQHRNEPRGVGGIFFDYLEGDFGSIRQFVFDCAKNFLPIYKQIVERRKELTYSDRERQFQLYRRSRYVEFNLVYDRGTKFGLQTGGRIESILMSMPPLVRWEYDHHPEPGSPEEKLYTDYLIPREWV